MKEHKIGEIFEYNGEWYQCLNGECTNCDLFIRSGCSSPLNTACSKRVRKDKQNVIFKKLEKVGEPYIIGNKLIQRYKIYPTTFNINVYGWYYQNLDVKSWTIDIEIKQNKEDMEEKNLKPFDLQKAREGKPVCTRDGRKARIICFDRKSHFPIIALVETFVKEYNSVREDSYYYTIDGRAINIENESKDDLMMLPEKKEGWVNVYKGIDGVTFSKHPYTSKDEAIKKSGILFGRIDTIKVSWEE